MKEWHIMAGISGVPSARWARPAQTGITVYNIGHHRGQNLGSNTEEGVLEVGRLEWVGRINVEVELVSGRILDKRIIMLLVGRFSSHSAMKYCAMALGITSSIQPSIPYHLGTYLCTYLSRHLPQP